MQLEGGASAAGLCRDVDTTGHAPIQCAADFQPPFKHLAIAGCGSGHGLLAGMVCCSQPMLGKVAQGCMQVQIGNLFGAIVICRAQMQGAHFSARHPAAGALERCGKTYGHVVRASGIFFCWPRWAAYRPLPKLR